MEYSQIGNPSTTSARPMMQKMQNKRAGDADQVVACGHASGGASALRHTAGRANSQLPTLSIADGAPVCQAPSQNDQGARPDARWAAPPVPAILTRGASRGEQSPHQAGERAHIQRLAHQHAAVDAQTVQVE
jgi:hypothetical protein